MNYRGILFDLDGTLLNTNALIIQSFQHTYRVHFNRDVDVDIVRAYFGRPLRAALEYLGPDKVDEMTKTYREFNASNHDRLTRIFPDVTETLQRLYASGIKLAVVTSKFEERARLGLKLFDIEKYFSVVIGCDNCENHKPHPEPVELALKAIQLSASDCLMAGDSPADLKSAACAGVKTAAVRWTELPWTVIEAENADFVLASMKDLLSICGI
ncbi:MAG: HAD-superfamily hydrolase, subfamily variant 1 [Firmicutes bacterium]|nr:HAD-superfamily hydrolase, subfamily variant 1 [Bacillota bacterium]